MRLLKLALVVTFLLVASSASGFDCPSETSVRSTVLAEWRDTWCEVATGEKHGPYESTWVTTGAPRLSGQYAKGDREGTWNSWYSDGTKSAEHSYSDGQSHGRTSMWHPDGTVKQAGDYVRGKKAGRWMRYFADGQPSEEENYTDGKLDGSFRSWHVNGVVKQSGDYRNGQETGQWATRSAGGELMQTSVGARRSNTSGLQRLPEIISQPVVHGE